MKYFVFYFILCLALFGDNILTFLKCCYLPRRPDIELMKITFYRTAFKMWLGKHIHREGVQRGLLVQQLSLKNYENVLFILVTLS